MTIIEKICFVIMVFIMPILFGIKYWPTDRKDD